MSFDDYRLVSSYNLKEYPCGIRAGNRLRLREQIRVKDHKDRETGKVYSAGEVWIVLPSVEDESDIIWLHQPDGNRHTWDADDITETFELVDR